MIKPTYKKIQLVLVVITFGVLFTSLYLQYRLNLDPCPLCMMQRLCVFILLGLLGLSLTTQKKAHIISFIQICIALAGLFFACRQLWLQFIPAQQAPACMPGLDVLIRYFPWQAVAHALFWGTGDCAEVSWTLLGISMPGWAAMYFFIMVVVSFFLFLQTRTSRSAERLLD